MKTRLEISFKTLLIRSCGAFFFLTKCAKGETAVFDAFGSASSRRPFRISYSDTRPVGAKTSNRPFSARPFRKEDDLNLRGAHVATTWYNPGTPFHITVTMNVLCQCMAYSILSSPASIHSLAKLFPMR